MSLKIENINMLSCENIVKDKKLNNVTDEYKDKVYNNRKNVLGKLSPKTEENLRHLTVSSLIIN